MAYYVYPVYVLATLIVLILSIIFIIYTLHFYKFVKSRIVFIKLESEDNNLNNWTFDLYPFTSSRIWKVFGYAIVCLPATFQQASTILVCQCKVIKFKTVLPKSVCDEVKGTVTPALLKKKFPHLPTVKDLEEDKTDFSPQIVIDEPEDDVSKLEGETHLGHKCNCGLVSTSLKVNGGNEEKNNNNNLSTESITENDSLKRQSETVSTNKQLHSCCEQKKPTIPEKIMQSLRKSPARSLARPKSTVINMNPPEQQDNGNDPNISIMSIDNLYESDYFIIPEAKPLQKLVVFNEPFNSCCPICLDDFELDEEIALLACHHGYHKDCLNKALRQNSSCPYCKSESNVRAFKVAEEIPLLWQTMSRRNSSAVNV